jgi:MYXO-CTERM domain-containing protein
MLATGGYSWSRHVSDASVEGDARTALYDTAWSAVLMQEFTDVAVKDPTSAEWLASLTAGTELVRAVEANGADAYLYMTWGDRTGDATYPDFPAMQGALETAYASYRDTMRTGGLNPYVVPAGVAWRMVYEAETDPDDTGSMFYRLYASDGQHPSALGSYLTACVMYSALTGLSSVGLPEVSGVTPSQAGVLQGFADEAVFGPESAAYDYPWTSSGGGEDTGTDDTGVVDTGNGDSGGTDTADDSGDPDSGTDSGGPDSGTDSGGGDTGAPDVDSDDDTAAADPTGEDPGCGCASGRGTPSSAFGVMALAALAAGRRRRAAA